MKLGISMLVIGLLFAGFGVYLWKLADAGPVASDWFSTEAIGMAVTVFGSGLSIAGIVRMVVKR